MQNQQNANVIKCKCDKMQTRENVKPTYCKSDKKSIFGCNLIIQHVLVATIISLPPKHVDN